MNVYDLFLIGLEPRCDHVSVSQVSRCVHKRRTLKGKSALARTRKCAITTGVFPQTHELPDQPVALQL